MPRFLVRTLLLAWLAAPLAWADAVAVATTQYEPESFCNAANAQFQTGDSATVAREQIAQTPRGPIGYFRLGQGTPIVLVTGFRATMANWGAAFLAALARHHEVIVFDNRGIGRSIPDANTFSIEDMAQDTAALIASLGLRRPALLGWSMGGTVVQQLVADQPDLAGKVILMGTLAPDRYGAPVPRRVMQTLGGGRDVTFADVMRTLFPPPVVPEAVECFIQDMFRPAGYRPPAIPPQVTQGQEEALNAWPADIGVATALRASRIEALILAGTQDGIVPVQNSQALARLLPDARLIVVAGAGHAMMFQYPSSLARTIGRFAEGIPVNAPRLGARQEYLSGRAAPE
jgi:pimeloyl-ACP methyl ester carboxylesterase